jgi:carbamoyltransferase
MIYSPKDALDMFYGSRICSTLIMEDILVKDGMDWHENVG